MKERFAAIGVIGIIWAVSAVNGAMANDIQFPVQPTECIEFISSESPTLTETENVTMNVLSLETSIAVRQANGQTVIRTLRQSDGYQRSYTSSTTWSLNAFDVFVNSVRNSVSDSIENSQRESAARDALYAKWNLLMKMAEHYRCADVRSLSEAQDRSPNDYVREASAGDEYRAEAVNERSR